MDDKRAVYGVDIAKATFTWANYDSQGTTRVANAADAIGDWLGRLPAGSIIAMEATGCYHKLLQPWHTPPECGCSFSIRTR